MGVKVEIKDNKLLVVSDYSHEFVKKAKRLNGKWNSNAWVFNPEDEKLVRKALIEIYGTDGNSLDKVVNVKLNLDEFDCKNERGLELFGRSIIYRFGRDKDVKMHSTVIILEGGFPNSGGSMKYPELRNEPGTVLEIKEVPLTLVEKAIEEYGSGVEIIEEEEVNVDELIKEKNRLLKRISEIDSIISNAK